MKSKIFVALSTFAEHGKEPLDILKSSGFDFALNTTGNRLKQEDIVLLAADCAGVVAGVEPYDASVLERLTQLRCISRCGAGMDTIDLKKAQERGVRVLNTPEVVVRPVAELTVAMILDLLKKLTQQTALMRVKDWQKKTGNLLAGKRVGIVGFGRIGQKVAQLLKPFEAEIGYYDINEVWEMISHRFGDLDSLLQWADIVTLHAAVSPGSTPLLGRDQIRKMKPGSWLVNTSRGGVVDEEALYVALKDGHLKGAALDVFSEEPYRGKLCELDNVILTPHIATLTEESRLQMEVEATQNLVHFLKNEH